MGARLSLQPLFELRCFCEERRRVIVESVRALGSLPLAAARALLPPISFSLASWPRCAYAASSCSGSTHKWDEAALTVTFRFNKTNLRSAVPSHLWSAR